MLYVLVFLVVALGVYRRDRVFATVRYFFTGKMDMTVKVVGHREKDGVVSPVLDTEEKVLGKRLDDTITIRDPGGFTYTIRYTATWGK